MVKTLHIPDPDSSKLIPVTVDAPNVDVIAVTLSRGDVEGNSRALMADVVFDTSVKLPKPGQEYEFDVEVDVSTDGHEVRMRDGRPITSITELQDPWDLASTSGGHGDIQSVSVRTILR